jgi:hypothetical protein
VERFSRRQVVNYVRLANSRRGTGLGVSANDADAAIESSRKIAPVVCMVTLTRKKSPRHSN